MLRFIDISSWQGGLSIAAVSPSIDACVIKATEGVSYVNPFCDPWVQECVSLGKPWGFYHFAAFGDAYAEARYFYDNCSNYFGKGVPVLDWEGGQSVEWVNTFVRAVHDMSGVWPWIYANPWRFNQGGVEANCGRWVASYPDVASPSFETAESWEVPDTDGLVCAWQFCSDGRVPGYGGDLDCNLFYGDTAAWGAYAGSSNAAPPAQEPNNSSILENDEYRVVVERK